MGRAGWLAVLSDLTPETVPHKEQDKHVIHMGSPIANWGEKPTREEAFGLFPQAAVKPSLFFGHPTFALFVCVHFTGLTMFIKSHVGICGWTRSSERVWPGKRETPCW